MKKIKEIVEYTGSTIVAAIFGMILGYIIQKLI